MWNKARRRNVSGAAALLFALLFVPVSLSAGASLGEIEFFGSKGIDVEAIRAALPFREGDAFLPQPELKRTVGEKVKAVIGREATSVTFVCCDSQQRWMVYIGLPGGTFQPSVFYPAPSEKIRLPPEIVKLNDNFFSALMKAVTAGRDDEDDSQGYALPADPTWRRTALAIRKYALSNEALVRQVLASSSDVKHRAIAAMVLGYGRQSDTQIEALVHASLDPDGEVRNNATRALLVLAEVKPELARKVPVSPFIGLLRSGEWTDRNKASGLLMEVTKSRDPSALAELRAEAIDALTEMALWRDKGHAEAARLILGRVGGIEEERLKKLADTGQVHAILSSLLSR
jgi:hypothetical protein